MGLTDFSSKVITFFKADVSDMKAGLKELTGAEKDLAKAQVESAEQRNKGLDEWVERLGNANQALELVGKAVEFGKDAFNEYADDLRMRAAAGAIDLDRLKSASLGLRTEDELLAFAAKTQHGMYKLTQEQMEQAQRAMVGLTRAGFDQKEVVDKVTEALVTGKTRGLKEFGIAVKSTGDETESLNAIMEELADKATGVSDGQRTAAESVQAAGVSIGDAFNNIKQSIGELVASMAPLIQAFAKAVGTVADIVEWSLKLPGRVWDSITGEAYKQSSGSSKWDQWNSAHGYNPDSSKQNLYNPFTQQAANANPFVDPTSFQFATSAFNGKVDDNWAQSTDASISDDAQFYIWSGGLLRRIPKPPGTGTGLGKFSDYATRSGDIAGAPIGWAKPDQYGAAMAQASGYGVPDLVAGDPLGEQIKKINDEITAEQAKLAAEAKAKHVSFLESTFGKLDDFHAYSEAFNMLTGSVTASIDAWIDGSESAGKAFQKFIGNALKGLASHMAIEALKYGAYAVAALVPGPFFDPGAAAGYAATAAAFGAGAAAAAVAAKEMGGGASTPAHGSSAGGGSGGGRGASGSNDHRTGDGGNGKQGNVTYVIPYGDAFFDLPETAKRRKAQEIVNRAVPGAHGYTNS